MKRMMNAGAIALGGLLVVTLAACSSSDPSPGAPTPDAPPAAGKAPKLSLVHSPAAVAAAKNLAVGASKAKGASHTLSAGAAGTCGITSGDPTCDTCITNTCCTEGAACTADADCSALLACYDACTDDTCFGTCDSAHRAGTITLQTFITCVESSCATDCGGSSGPPPSSGTCGGVTSGDASCDACLTTTCCADVTSCIDDADCTNLMDCLQSCSDSTCETACETAHPAGTAELTSLSSCVDTNCAACTGGSSPPPPTAPPSAPSCGLSSSDATCDACLDASCCTESETCVRDADCNALLVCMGNCTDDACVTECTTAHPSGSSLLDSVVSCLSTSCSASCF